MKQSPEFWTFIMAVGVLGYMLGGITVWLVVML